MIARACSMLTLLCVGVSVAVASGESPAQNVMRQLAESLICYTKETGRHPTNWMELPPYIDQRWMERRAVASRVLLLTNVVRAHESASASFVAVTATTIDEDGRKELGRYAILQEEDVYRSVWMGEDEVKRAFQAAGVALPTGEVWVQPDTGRAFAGRKLRRAFERTWRSIAGGDPGPSVSNQAPGPAPAENPGLDSMAVQQRGWPWFGKALIVLALFVAVCVFFFLRRAKPKAPNS